MSEQKQATMLAQWLDQGDGAEAIDTEVMEAVLVLRPDLAPSANVDIDEILNEVLIGPLASEADAESITALMQWMEQRPGETPPADTDPEVMEAVLAMRPDLAPPLRVDMAQILGQVSSGPLAAVKSNPNDLVSLGAVRSQREDRKGMAIAVGFGLLAAAATTLFAIRVTGDRPVVAPASNGEAVEVARTVEQVAPETPPPQSATGRREAQRQTDQAFAASTDAVAKELNTSDTIQNPKMELESESTPSSQYQSTSPFDSNAAGTVSSTNLDGQLADAFAKKMAPTAESRLSEMGAGNRASDSHESIPVQVGSPPAPAPANIANSSTSTAVNNFAEEMDMADAVSELAIEEEPLAKRPSSRSSRRSAAPSADYLPAVGVKVQKVDITNLANETDILSNDIGPDIQTKIEMDIDKGLNRIRSCVNGHVSALDTGHRVLLTSNFQVANQRATNVETSMTNSQALPANGVGLPPCINAAYQSIHFTAFDGTTQVQVVVELD